MFYIKGHPGGIQEAGIYSWWLNDDKLFGDTAVAALFGHDHAQTIWGLSISSYIERVYVNDR